MDVTSLLLGFGPLALAVIFVLVFIENGLLFPFLPGDSLLFAGGVLAGALHISWLVIVAIAALAAILGAEVGFLIGRRYGRRMFKPDARVFKTEYLDRTEQFFERWGRWAIVLARFVPVVRTYISPAAGASGMRHRPFSIWNAVSGVVWALIIGVCGVLLGKIPFVAAHIEGITVAIIAVTLIPAGIGLIARTRRRRAEARATATVTVRDAARPEARSHQDAEPGRNAVPDDIDDGPDAAEPAGTASPSGI